MPIFKRTELPEVIKEISDGHPSQIYLVFGERFLCQQIANDLIAALLPDEENKSQALMNVDGDHEDPLDTLNLLRTYSLFGGQRLIKVTDSKLFFSRSIAENIWDKAVRAGQEKKEKSVNRYLRQFLAMAPEIADSETPCDDLAELSGSKWRELFGFAKPPDTGWLREIKLEPTVEKSSRGDIGQLYIQTLEQGLPPGHLLLLLAESVDKRTRLFTFIKKQGIVIDAAVDSGASKAARQDQREVLASLVNDTFNKYGKTITEKVRQALLERVGFHPVAAVMEAEKLALYADADKQITIEHLDAVTCRSREDALFELFEAIALQQQDLSLLLMKRLQEGGMHALAIISGLRNFVRKMLLARSLQLTLGGFKAATTYPSFQKNMLPELQHQFKKETADLPSHPYALYNIFKQAASFSIGRLQNILSILLEGEYVLKSTPLAPSLVLDTLLFQVFLHNRN
jgi:DNA polymerase-3 subunit delta